MWLLRYSYLLIALTIYHAAHMAETVRAGILSVNRGQDEAARAHRAASFLGAVARADRGSMQHNGEAGK